MGKLSPLCVVSVLDFYHPVRGGSHEPTISTPTAKYPKDTPPGSLVPGFWSLSVSLQAVTEPCLNPGNVRRSSSSLGANILTRETWCPVMLMCLRVVQHGCLDHVTSGKSMTLYVALSSTLLYNGPSGIRSAVPEETTINTKANNTKVSSNRAVSP